MVKQRGATDTSRSAMSGFERGDDADETENGAKHPKLLSTCTYMYLGIDLENVRILPSLQSYWLSFS